jgi:putative addiction module killer protein
VLVVLRSCSPTLFSHLDHAYSIGYGTLVLEIRQTDEYAAWFQRLRDRQAQVRINARIRRLSLGNPGDVKPVGEGVSELRIDYGPGYRVYFIQQGNTLVVLLAGGDKRTQDRDIQTALTLARNL